MTDPHHRKRMAFKTAERRAEISKLYREGLSQPQIADRLGISQQAVSKHIAVLTAEWKESAAVDFFMHQAQALEEFNHDRAETYAAFNRSKIAQEGQGDPDDLPGDPRFLAIAVECTRAKCELLGLNAPKKKEISGSIDVNDASSMDDRQLEEAIRRAHGMIPATDGPLLLEAPKGNGNGNGNGSNGGGVH